MTITLHPKTREALKKKIAGLLPGMIVEADSRIKWHSFTVLRGVDDAAAFQAQDKELLLSCIGEDPIYSFSMHLFDEAMESRLSLQHVPDKTIIEVLGRSPEQIADNILDNLAALPTPYKVVYPLSSNLADDLSIVENDYEVATDASLSEFTAESDASFPGLRNLLESFKSSAQRPVGLGLLGHPAPEINHLSRNRLLKFRSHGAIDKYSSFGTAQDCSDFVKAFFGLAMSIELLEGDIAALFSDITQKYNLLVAYRDDGRRSDVPIYIRLEDFAATFISRLRLARKLRDMPIPQRVPQVYAGLSLIKRVLSSGEPGERVRRAARWYLDSFAGQNELLSYVQATVCMEILFGEDRHIGNVSLNDIISNRCAYLIGRDHKDRETLINSFKEIYKVRSLIVHKGKSRLAFSERRRFYELRDICMRSLVAEIELIGRMASPGAY